MPFNIKDEIDKATAEQLAKESGLSAQEIAFVPRHTVGETPLLLERDTFVDFGGTDKIAGCLRAYGRWIPPFPGSRETPPEAGYYDVTSVTLSLGGEELEIWEALGRDEIEEIALACYEENPR
jgi:hypothetical protein